MEVLNIEKLDIDKLIKFTQSIIEFDNTELIAQVNEMINKFRGLVITEEMLPEIKKDRAALNNIVKDFETARKKIAAEYKSPLLEFEGKIKGICAIIENQVKEFDQQTAEFEIKRREIKKELVERMISDVCIRKNLDEIKYSSQLTFIDRYYNVTEKDSMIIKDLELRADQILIQQKNDELAEELRVSKIKNREMLLSSFNLQNSSNFTYSSFTIEKYADDQEVINSMQSQIAMRDEADKAVIIEKRPINVAITEPTHNNLTVDYIELRIYCNQKTITHILDRENLQYTLISSGKKTITTENNTSPF